MSAASSPNHGLSASARRSTSKNTSGASLAMAFFISPSTRAGESASVFIVRIFSSVFASGDRRNRAANCAPRSTRSGSSAKPSPGTARSTPRRRSACPPKGSTISPVSASRKIALTVKSRRAAARAKGSAGSSRTSKSPCFGPVRRSSLGTARSIPAPLREKMPYRAPLSSTSPNSAARLRSACGARPYTSQSISALWRPVSASRTQPPTSMARPPSAFARSAIPRIVSC